MKFLKKLIKKKIVKLVIKEVSLLINKSLYYIPKTTGYELLTLQIKFNRLKIEILKALIGEK